MWLAYRLWQQATNGPVLVKPSWLQHGCLPGTLQLLLTAGVEVLDLQCVPANDLGVP